MKKILLATFVLIAVNGLYAQKIKSKKIVYVYDVYPQVRYDKNINSYYIRENYESNFLKGKLDVNSEKDMFTKVYSFVDKPGTDGLKINELNKTKDKGLKIIINYRSVGNANDLVNKMNEITEGFIKSGNPAVLMEKHKYNLLFAEVKIYSDTLILSKSFSKKSLYKNEYVQYYKNKTGKKPYSSSDYKIEFSDIEANALYFVEKDLDLLKKNIYEYINEMVGFNKQKTTLIFYTVKSKKYDYSETDDLQKNVIEAVKNKDKKVLNTCFRAWYDMIEKADYDNEDSKYNAAVVGALYVNAYSVCLVSEDFISAAILDSSILLALKKLKKSDLQKIVSLRKEIGRIRANRRINNHRF